MLAEAIEQVSLACGAARSPPTSLLRALAEPSLQVFSSQGLRSFLQRVLCVGNYLNGQSARGGAYGFKLADLAKLVQVKSADSQTTLLHYLCRRLEKAPAAESVAALDEQLSQLEGAKDADLGEMRAELAKLGTAMRTVQSAKAGEGAFARQMGAFAAEAGGLRARAAWRAGRRLTPLAVCIGRGAARGAAWQLRRGGRARQGARPAG